MTGNALWAGLTRRGRGRRTAAVLLAIASVGACATADGGVDAYDRAQHRAADPVLRGERVIEDAGARLTGTEPAYKKGGSFFINPSDSRSAFGTD